MHRNSPVVLTSGLLLVLFLGISGLEVTIADESPGLPSGAPVTSAVPDTVTASTPQDTPLILSLPGRLQDRPVTHYKVLRGPALCGVAGHSFTWIPRGAQNPPYYATLQAMHPNPPSDTLVVRMDIES